MAEIINYSNIASHQLKPGQNYLSGEIRFPLKLITVGTTLTATLTAERYSIEGHNSWIDVKSSTFNIDAYVNSGAYSWNTGDQGLHQCHGSWDFWHPSKTDTLSFTTTAPITNPLTLHEVTNKSDHGTAKMTYNLNKNVASEATYNSYFKGNYITAKGWKLSNSSWTPVALIAGDYVLALSGWTREGAAASSLTMGDLPLASWISFEGDMAVFSTINNALDAFFDHRGEKITTASACVLYPGTIRHKGSGWSSYERVFYPDFVY